MKKYPRQLSHGLKNPLFGLNHSAVAKKYPGDTGSDIGSEANKMQYANSINDPEVKIKRHNREFAKGWDLKRLFKIPGGHFKNIFFTPNGIRHIDAGISFIKKQAGDKVFTSAIEKKREEPEQLKTFFLNR